jgi:hypothetical protein
LGRNAALTPSIRSSWTCLCHPDKMVTLKGGRYLNRGKLEAWLHCLTGRTDSYEVCLRSFSGDAHSAHTEQKKHGVYVISSPRAWTAVSLVPNLRYSHSFIHSSPCWRLVTGIVGSRLMIERTRSIGSAIQTTPRVFMLLNLEEY